MGKGKAVQCLHKTFCCYTGIVQGAVTPNAVEQGYLIFRARIVQGMDEGQGEFTFNKIIANAFARGLGISLVIKQVIDDLEGNTYFRSIGCQCLLLL